MNVVSRFGSFGKEECISEDQFVSSLRDRGLIDAAGCYVSCRAPSLLLSLQNDFVVSKRGGRRKVLYDFVSNFVKNSSITSFST
ncbi:hypothetical protein L195_g035546, partial [Trifolium pratense]